LHSRCCMVRCHSILPQVSPRDPGELVLPFKPQTASARRLRCCRCRNPRPCQPLSESSCTHAAVWCAVVRSCRRFHLEILDSLCFPSSLKLRQQDASAAAEDATAPSRNTTTTATSVSDPPFSALDGLWQLLRQAPSLLSSQPKLLAAVLRALSTLWECQGSAHGAVELLRGQKDFWTAIKVCRHALFGCNNTVYVRLLMPQCGLL
jgi:hypothetical protein